jgi:hypothetical protein
MCTFIKNNQARLLQSAINSEVNLYFTFQIEINQKLSLTWKKIVPYSPVKKTNSTGIVVFVTQNADL